MKRVACIFFSKDIAERDLKTLAESAWRFSSQVALRPGEALFVETGRSSLLYSEPTLAARFRIMAKRCHRDFFLAFGADAAEALARARVGATETWSLGQLPLSSLLDWASPFQHDHESESRLLPMTAAFQDLGLGCLGDFLKLPREALGARFGSDAAFLSARIQEGFGMAWPRFQPDPVLRESFRMDPDGDLCGQDLLQPLLFALKGALDRMASRLTGRGLRATRLRLGLRLEGPRRGIAGIERVLDLAFPLPQGSAAGLFRIVSERLKSEVELHPLPAAVASLELVVLETAPGLGAQAHFFSSIEKETEAWNSLVVRLSQKLGPDQVFLAELLQCYLPEKAWKRMMKPLPDPAAPVEKPAFAPRPSRFLAKPLPLSRNGDELLQFSAPQRRWRVRSWQGPERISGSWWDEDFDRDYYQVETEQGRRLWLYSSAGSSSSTLWLQGYFD